MAPAYKLTYFDVRGLAEGIRFLFKYGKVDFEDIRLNRDDWPTIKATMPFGQVPLLEHNGKRISQSISICRYLGRELNLAGSNNWESLEIDSIADTVVDFRTKLSAAAYEKDEKVKEEKLKVVMQETIPYYLKKFDELAKKNNGHLALGKLTWVDFVFVAGMDTLNFFAKTDLLVNYPNLQQLQKKITSIPEIKQWIAVRPKSDL